MKKMLFLLVFTVQTTLGQNGLVRNYETFNIKNVSGETLKLINAELYIVARQDYTRVVQAGQDAFYNRFNLGDSLKKTQYINYYNATLQRSRAALNNEVLLQTNKYYLATYALDGLSYYTGNSSSEEVAAFIIPAIQAGAQKYAEKQVIDALRDTPIVQPSVDRLTTYAVSYLQARNVAASASIIDIRQNLRNLHNTVPYPDNTAEAFAGPVFDFLADKARSRLAVPVAGLVLTEPEFRNVFNQVTNIARDSAQASFKQLASDITILVANESRAQVTINAIEQEWKTTNTQIQDFNSRISNPEITPTDFTQQERRVAQNSVRLEVINLYVNKGLQLAKTAEQAVLQADKIRKQLEKVFDPVNREQFINQLSSLNAPTLSQTISAGADAARFLNTAFPNNPTFKKVASFVQYAVSAVNIGTGVGLLFSMQPMGIINVMQGLQGLFGGGPPPRSPELQMMDQMMGYMEGQFDQITGRLDRIDQKLNRIDEKLNYLMVQCSSCIKIQ
ncbi:hypothetical protein AHMF7605_03445 [Adhaeribacter arboris]|uniref:Uncharacterized protein n=1 Tax=Adhaeribacter arboris TaxID=2072846 RepID=A0A2T2YAY1_9BACT|nr:hypothetical protein [Adhaeribacter arboris]PSR52646.1 hypothetical protein AHMF7605_03445 [Adhaeribacter arboris]